jgi:hypothetical protein
MVAGPVVLRPPLPGLKRESPPACHLAETIQYTLGPGISLQKIFCYLLHFKLLETHPFYQERDSLSS